MNFGFDLDADKLKAAGRAAASRLPGGSTMDKVDWMRQQFEQQQKGLKLIGSNHFPTKLSNAKGQDPVGATPPPTRARSVGLILHDRGPKPVFAPLPNHRGELESVAKKLAAEGIERVPTLTEDELREIEEKDKQHEELYHAGRNVSAESEAQRMKLALESAQRAAQRTFAVTVPHKANTHPFISQRFGAMATNPLAAFLPADDFVAENVHAIQKRLMFKDHIAAQEARARRPEIEEVYGTQEELLKQTIQTRKGGHKKSREDSKQRSQTRKFAPEQPREESHVIEIKDTKLTDTGGADPFRKPPRKARPPMAIVPTMKKKIHIDISESSSSDRSDVVVASSESSLTAPVKSMGKVRRQIRQRAAAQASLEETAKCTNPAKRLLTLDHLERHLMPPSAESCSSMSH